MHVGDLIRSEIRGQGPIPFERFMDLALYAPDCGYYTKPGPSPVGKAGDFITSVSSGPLFGRILAHVIEGTRRELNDPAFTVVEYGAHRGALRSHILTELPDLNYLAIDVGDSEPAAITGCVLANELLDALPVHRVHASKGQWLEWYVEADVNGAFQWSLGPLSSETLHLALAPLPVQVMDNYTTEINLRALEWIDTIAQRLKRGAIILIDYGYERVDYFAPHRHQGTLTCYRQHSRGNDPLLLPGEQDITAHVEFSSLIDRAKSHGFEVKTFETQEQFLLKAGRALIHQGAIDPTSIQQLTHPNFMGQAFKVLILARR